MLATIIILLIMVLIIAGIFFYPLLIERRRNSLKNLPFPPLWRTIIENNLPIYPFLSPDERRRLQGHIQVFVTEKQFIGCRGLEVTLEMKIIIAAVACLLLLNEQGRCFSKLHSILVYPGAYLAQQTTSLGDYIVEEKMTARLGESWSKDQVVLAWEQIKKDTTNWTDGHNLILHEFAHQLDQEDGQAQGVPLLPKDLDYQIWAEIMTKEYQKLCYEVQEGVNTVIDSYGATNPAEFFAVVTETFFEKPLQLLSKHSALYKQLQKYYKLDPVQWYSAIR